MPFRKKTSDINNIEETQTASHAETDGAGKKKETRILRTFAITAVVLLLAVGSLVVLVDPFFHYHRPLQGFPYVVDNQLSQNPGMARQMSYDSCVIGSSMTVNFNSNDFAELLGLKTLKLSCSGALPHDDYRMLQIVYDETSPAREENEVKAVFMAMDTMTFTAEPAETKYPWQEYLCDQNPFNDIRYLFNKDVLLQYILRPMIEREGTDLANVYASWWTPEYYNRELVLEGYTPAEISEEEMDREQLISGTDRNLEENILPFIADHPETTFYCFFPPYSILYWNDVCRENHLEATLEQIRYMTETLLAYDNVRVFYFQDMEDVVTDLDNYADYTHYKPEINRYMTECFASGEHEVREGEIGNHLANVKKMIDDCDLTAFQVAEQE